VKAAEIQMHLIHWCFWD